MSEWPDEVSIDVTVIAQTDKALRVRLEEDDRELWVPQSQISDNSEVWKNGDFGELVISRWFAEKEGLCW